MEGIKLTIFVPSVSARRNTFLLKSMNMLYGQLEALPKSVQSQVEILYLVDNKSMMLGSKRNIAIDISSGKYIAQVDCDDEVSDDYIASLIEAIDESDADVISFTAMVSINGGKAKPCYYSIGNKRDYNTEEAYYRIPNHICCVKKEVSLKSSFPNVLRGEDAGYSKLLLPHIKSEHKIDKVLYYYNYNDRSTETQMELPSIIRQRNLPPIVDVVILSKGSTPHMRSMCQTAIDTCIAGANSLPLNIMVVEQVKGVGYKNAKTIHHDAGSEFCYNANCNIGARQGKAEWILFCNSDLIFSGGFLHELIAAGNDLVSPHEPRDPRQRGLIGNEIGEHNGKHFSGWCFMMKRSLWEKIGGLSEEFKFWFSDDVTIQQCLKVGVKPMIVTKSIVKHLGSVTFKTLDQQKQEEYTWEMTKAFNEKYGQNKFENNKYYQDYLKRNI